MAYRRRVVVGRDRTGVVHGRREATHVHRRIRQPQQCGIAVAVPQMAGGVGYGDRGADVEQDVDLVPDEPPSTPRALQRHPRTRLGGGHRCCGVGAGARGRSASPRQRPSGPTPERAARPGAHGRQRQQDDRQPAISPWLKCFARNTPHETLIRTTIPLRCAGVGRRSAAAGPACPAGSGRPRTAAPPPPTGSANRTAPDRWPLPAGTVTANWRWNCGARTAARCERSHPRGRRRPQSRTPWPFCVNRAAGTDQAGAKWPRHRTLRLRIAMISSPRVSARGLRHRARVARHRSGRPPTSRPGPSAVNRKAPR